MSGADLAPFRADTAPFGADPAPFGAVPAPSGAEAPLRSPSGSFLERRLFIEADPSPSLELYWLLLERQLLLGAALAPLMGAALAPFWS